MGFADLYLTRYGIPFTGILPDIHKSTSLIVIIPSYGEKGLSLSVESLIATIPADVFAEIIIVINHPEGASREYIGINTESLEWAKCRALEMPLNIKLIPIFVPDLPSRHAGVGFARKIGMDTAIQRFNMNSSPEGILVSFDADSQCSQGFIEKLVLFYLHHPSVITTNHFFEHPLVMEGREEDSRISGYELHLRYFKLALEWAGHPHAIHTVGSSFSVRARGYIKAGGMGRHKAGEDFYFLHKMVRLGHFWENSEMTVYPSARVSDRVIFGTGATIGNMVYTTGEFLTYPFELFGYLRYFFDLHNNWVSAGVQPTPDIQGSGIHESLAEYLSDSGLLMKLASIPNQTASPVAIHKRFYNVFDVFQVLRYLNFACKNFCTKSPVGQAAKKLARELGIEGVDDGISNLRNFRNYERGKGVRRVS